MGETWHGLRYPFKRGPQGWFGDADDDEIIESSIKFILGFMLQDYICLPEFGCNLGEALFEPNDKILEQRAIRYIFDSLARWESRIFVRDVQTTAEEERLNVRIEYVRVQDPTEIRFFNDSFERLAA